MQNKLESVFCNEHVHPLIKEFISYIDSYKENPPLNYGELAKMMHDLNQFMEKFHLVFSDLQKINTMMQKHTE